MKSIYCFFFYHDAFGHDADSNRQHFFSFVLSICFFIPPCGGMRGAAQPHFIRASSIVFEKNGSPLKNPWAGGINFAQFSKIDLNLDGISDLFVFDRSGNKVTCFLNNGTPDSVDYSHAPEYESRFPRLHDWALLRDYNCDGKVDIFSYSNAGFSVWKNTSDITNGLQFTLDTANMYFLGFWRVASDFGYGTYNLYVSLVDIPAISDMDNDGDLDILTFGVAGTMVEFHRNKSMELFGNCDSLKYEFVSGCWGNFSENGLDNTLSYPVICKSGNIPPLYDFSDQTVHTGSTILAFDIDCDSDNEIALGDVSFGNLVLAVNGGSVANAQVTGHDYNFPSYDVPVDLRIFPGAFYLDMNNDSLRDLVVSPNVRNVSENFNSVLFYSNTGSDCSPQFSYRKSNLLQDEMLDLGEGSYPVFFDFNADGLEDILIGNYGYYAISGGYPSKIAALKNTGTASSPQFEVDTLDYAGLGSLGLSNIYPAPGDLDGDGDEDLLAGVRDGYLVYFQNTAGTGNPANFQFAQTDYQGIDVGNFAAPQIIDLDGDGLSDLVIGEQNGNLNYYRNTGSASAPVFTLQTDSLGKVKTTSQMAIQGYSSPYFYYDDSGQLKLICGTEDGYLRFYDNISGNLNGEFDMITPALDSISEGYRTRIHCSDINNDGKADMVIGNYRGGIALYFGDTLITAVRGTPIETNQITVNAFHFPGEMDIILPGSFDVKGLHLTFFDLSGREVASYPDLTGMVINYGKSVHIRIRNISFTSGIYLGRLLSETFVLRFRITGY
ncbi:MAG: VCBS repeat-containing protein [Bacteroidetes bacterium]|nr:VCBS repeat-containing protein [Bacteroidota bacterium]